MRNIKLNSKQVSKNDVFIAFPCQDVQLHITEALKNGASLVISECPYPDNRVQIVPDARLFASEIAKKQSPEEPKVSVAITGTNGKSSTAHFLNQIWMNLGLKSANLGTLGLFIGLEKATPRDFKIPNLTTPDAFTLRKIMKYLLSNEITHFVFEASSHALEQKRLHNVNLGAAAFTNLASDHLDYHKTKSNYLTSKLRLFSEILPKRHPAIVSKDYPELYEAVKLLNNSVLTFGLQNKNDINASNIKTYSDKIIFDLNLLGTTYKDVEIKVFGEFQVMNVLCAIALACATTNFEKADIANVLPKILPLNGRMEHVRSIGGGSVYVDYAHTSEGFKNALKCFKKACKGRLICVFGCGGDRDKSKRTEMGKIASELADVVIVTDDNPRTESPESIRSEIIKNCPNAIEIPNRKEAIHKGISLIKANDFVVIIGKGHEEYQIYSDRITHLHDKAEVLNFS